MKILVVRQPWAWLLIHGGKDIENRTWRTNYRGPLIIQASASRPRDLAANCRLVADRFGINVPANLDYGGAIGVVMLEDCVDQSASKWFEGPIGWVVGDPKPLPFFPLKGGLGLREASPKLAAIAERALTRVKLKGRKS